MAQNFETRQDIVGETPGNSGGPRDMLRKMARLAFGVPLVIAIEQGKNAIKEKKQRKEEREYVEFYENTESTSNAEFKQEITDAITGVINKIDVYNRVAASDGIGNFRAFDAGAPATNARGKGEFGENTWLNFFDDSKYFDHSKPELVKGQMIMGGRSDEHGDEYALYYYEKDNGYDVRLLMKDIDGTPLMIGNSSESMTIGAFRTAVEMINNDIDNRIKKAQNNQKRAMERIAGQKIAQNNEEYHQQEEQQADADLESQLGNLA